MASQISTTSHLSLFSARAPPNYLQFKPNSALSPAKIDPPLINHHTKSQNHPHLFFNQAAAPVSPQLSPSHHKTTITSPNLLQICRTHLFSSTR
jgi:hypothetical protein